VTVSVPTGANGIQYATPPFAGTGVNTLIAPVNPINPDATNTLQFGTPSNAGTGTNSLIPSSSSAPTNAYVTEDGTKYYVTEDGTKYYVQESRVPGPAAANGYNNQLFFDDFTSQTVDIGLTHTGKNWYIDNQPNFIVSQTGPASNPAWFTQSGSVLTMSTNYNTSVAPFSAMSLYAPVGGATYTSQVPLAVGANGFYVEGRMQAVPPASNENFMPDFWMNDIVGALEFFGNGSGQHYAEIDVVEMNTTATGVVHFFHDWPSGNSTSSGTTNAGLDYTQYHKWGVLVIPMARGGGTGSLTWYVDGAVTGTPLTWTSTSQLGGIIEAGQFQINFGAALNAALNIDYIGIWTP
jgi:hypothetical protein